MLEGQDWGRTTVCGASITAQMVSTDTDNKWRIITCLEDQCLLKEVLRGILNEHF